MQLKQPTLTNVSLKMSRGLVGIARKAAGGSFIGQNNMLFVVEGLAEAQFVDLKPGEETEVLVELPRAQLPGSADVKSVAATLYVVKPDLAALKGRDQSVVGVKDLGLSTDPKPDAPERSFALRMDAPGGPRNVELRLGDGPAFWTHAGTLDEGPHPLPDFSEQLNQVLDSLPPEASSITLRFRLKSDTPGKIRIQIGRIEFGVLHTQSWTNPLDDTVRVERNLQLDFGSQAHIPLQPPELPNLGFTLASVTMDIGGQLGPERLLGSVAAHGDREFATLSSAFSLAQSFILENPIRLTGLAGFFRAEVEAELYAEIQPDIQGVPANGPALSRASLTLPASSEGSQGWSYIPLDPAIDLEATKRYWMILKGVRSQVRLGLKVHNEEPFGEILINRGGLRWKRLGWAYNPGRLFSLDLTAAAWLGLGQASKELRQISQANGVTLSSSSGVQQSHGGWQVTDPESQRVYRIQSQQGKLEVVEGTLVGLLRLVYLPEIDNQTAAVEIRMEGVTSFQKIDPLPEAQNLTIPITAWQGQPLVLEVRSHARGTLSIANVVQEYRK
jgi:hypothetical protein